MFDEEIKLNKKRLFGFIYLEKYNTTFYWVIFFFFSGKDSFIDIIYRNVLRVKTFIRYSHLSEKIKKQFVNTRRALTPVGVYEINLTRKRA